jgi:hypothetical protein
MLKIRGMSNAETPFTKLCNNWNIPLEAVVDKGFKYNIEVRALGSNYSITARNQYPS